MTCPGNTVGFIKLYIGCMYADKSSSMLGEVDKYRIANKLCASVQFSEDTRYDSLAVNGGIITHSGREFASIPKFRSNTLSAIVDELLEYDVIGIDEVQFFPDCAKIASLLADNGKIVICAGLDGNFNADPFGKIGELIAVSEYVTKLNAICMVCCRAASFTIKISGGEEEIDIGGFDKYIVVCRGCRLTYRPISS